MHGLPSAAEIAGAQEFLRAPLPAVRAILAARRCSADWIVELLVAFERIQAGLYDDHPMLKRKQLAAEELGFTHEKTKRQVLNELIASQ